MNEAKLRIELPVVRIRLEDLNYLKGLLEKGPECIGSYKSADRLRLLGLIEDKELPPCPKQVKEHTRLTMEITRRIRIALAAHDIQSIAGLDWWRVKQVPKPRIVKVVTKAGRDLLAKGIAKATVQKGCK